MSPCVSHNLHVTDTSPTPWSCFGTCLLFFAFLVGTLGGREGSCLSQYVWSGKHFLLQGLPRIFTPVHLGLTTLGLGGGFTFGGFECTLQVCKLGAQYFLHGAPLDVTWGHGCFIGFLGGCKAAN